MVRPSSECAAAEVGQGVRQRRRPDLPVHPGSDEGAYRRGGDGYGPSGHHRRAATDDDLRTRRRPGRGGRQDPVSAVLRSRIRGGPGGARHPAGLCRRPGRTTDDVRCRGGHGAGVPGDGRFVQRPTRPLDELDNPDPMHVTLDFSANRCVVDVDPELGLVKVVQMDVAQDVGRVVNPIAAHGQICGGSVMGMGWPDGEPSCRGRSPGERGLVDLPDPDIGGRPRHQHPLHRRARTRDLLRHQRHGGVAPCPVATCRIVRAARGDGRALPVAPATAEMVAGIVDSEQSMSLVEVGRDERRGPWRVANADRRRGPWFDGGGGPRPIGCDAGPGLVRVPAVSWWS